jgi:hypothetical protein
MAWSGIRRLALLVLTSVAFAPGGAFAGSSPGPILPPTHYSPWHYKTPLLYRCWAEHYYGVTAGPCGPGCCGPVPSSPPAGQASGSPAEPAKRSDAASPTTPASSPATNGPQQGR